MAKKNAVTLFDVAQHVGYAKATVSYVLSGKAADVGVAQKTIEKIEAAAKELGYVRNYWASSLARQATGMISILLNDLAGDWADQIVRPMGQALRSKEYTPFLAADWDDPVLFEREVTAVTQRRDEGVICHSFIGDVAQYKRLTDCGIPLVFLGAVPRCLDGVSGVNSVIWDDAQAVETAVRHFIKMGRRKIGFVGVDHGQVSDHRRFAAYAKTLVEAGLEPNPAWQIWMSRKDFTAEFTQENIAALFAADDVPDALFALNDAVAHNVLLALKKAGVRVPEDVAVIGMGDLPISTFADLSTMREPLAELGQAAAQMILELIDDPSKEPLCRQVTCNELVIRNSTGG